MTRSSRACSSAKVVSLSSIFSASTPASRAAAFLIMSVAICTWRSSGNMSGYKRICSSTPASKPCACAWASPFTSNWRRLRKARWPTGTVAWYIERVSLMAVLPEWEERKVYALADPGISPGSRESVSRRARAVHFTEPCRASRIQ